MKLQDIHPQLVTLRVLFNIWSWDRGGEGIHAASWSIDGLDGTDILKIPALAKYGHGPLYNVLTRKLRAEIEDLTVVPRRRRIPDDSFLYHTSNHAAICDRIFELAKGMFRTESVVKCSIGAVIGAYSEDAYDFRFG